MKHISKMLALFLAFVLMFAMVACNGDEKPSDGKSNAETTDKTPSERKELTQEEYSNLFGAGFLKLSAVTQNGLSADMKMTASIPEIEFNTELSGNIDLAVADGEISDFLFSLAESESGYTQTAAFDGSYLYTTDGSEKIKIPADEVKTQLESLLEQIASIPGAGGSDGLGELPEAVQNALAAEIEPKLRNPQENVYVFSCSLNADNLKNIFNAVKDSADTSSDSLAALEEQLGQLLNLIRFDAFRVLITLNNNDNTMQVGLTLSASFDPDLLTALNIFIDTPIETASVTVDMTVNFKQLGKTVSVVLPEDLDSYMTQDELSRIQDDISEKLFDIDGQMLTGDAYDAAYAELAEKYDKATLDSFIDMYQNRLQALLNVA